ncbi:MAG: class I SAM-dependent methyltransferase [Candidatus Woesearchaeota archaeon]
MRYYDGISKGYGELHGREQLSKARIVAGLLDLQKDGLLLDVGCGDASYFGLFDCVKVGLDPSFELLKKAKDGFFVQGVAEALPFLDECFDAVVSITAVHNFEDLEKGLQEMHRVAKDRVVVSVLRQSERFTETVRLIQELFVVEREIAEAKDVVFVLRK